MIFAEIENSYSTKPDIPPAFSAISGISSKGIKMDAEQWMPVEGFLGYEVSNMGRIKSLRRFIAAGKIAGMRRERILRPRIVGAGYLQVILYRQSGRFSRYVHVLVAERWCQRPAGTTEVNHDNLNKADCRATNLIWTTRLGNMRHGTAAGRFRKAGMIFKTRREHRREARDLFEAMAKSECTPPPKPEPK